MKKNICFIVLIFIIFLITGCELEKKEITEYNSVIQEYQFIIESIYSEDFEKKYNSFAFSSPNENLKYEWSCMIADMYSNREGHSYGYFLYDYDQNGIEELFLVRDDYFILAIFTKQNNSSHMLDAFWSKHKCSVGSLCELYIIDSITAQDFNCYVKKYEEKTASLITAKTFGCNKGVYYENSDNETAIITIERYKELENFSENEEFYNKRIIYPQTNEVRNQSGDS